MNTVLMRELLGLALLNTAFLLAVAGPSRAAEQTVWQIGKFDRSSHEFNKAVDFADTNYIPTFRVGQSDPAKDWPAFQRGSQNKSLGGRPHPYAIFFDLWGQPKGLYRLRVAVILTHSRVPDFLVEINGHAGRFFFNRRLSYYPGDGGADSPVCGLATFPEYMRYVEQHYGPVLETVAGDFGPYWEDVYATDVDHLTILSSSRPALP